MKKSKIIFLSLWFFINSVISFIIAWIVSEVYDYSYVAALPISLIKVNCISGLSAAAGYYFGKTIRSKNFIAIYAQIIFFSLAGAFAGYLLGRFLVAIFSGTHLSGDPEALSVLLPIGLQIVIGIPSIIVIPRISSLKKRGSGFKFESNDEMFQSISLGLNPQKAKGLNLVLQFCLTGKENLDGFLTIKDQKCFYTPGVCDEFNVKIISDSEVWLSISSGRISGEKALMKNLYSIEGDLDALLDFNRLFSPEAQKKSPGEIYKRFSTFFKSKKNIYAEKKPGEIKKILIIDGSTRSRKFSKSMFMAEKFAEGAISAGAQIETITVRNHNIHGCTGCFNCFSKTPGICCQKDDMSELLDRIRYVDLLVFVSPLYVFSISSQLKAFIDRLLPLVQPYMEIHNNVVTHPPQYQIKKYVPMVIFSAGGFPEVKDNFDGISGMFHAWGKHKSGSGGGLMGEFYLPAAEMIAQPVHRERKKNIEMACFNAGVQVIKEGRIDVKFMTEISRQGISQKEFQWQANNFWEMFQGKSYLKMAPGLYQKD